MQFAWPRAAAPACALLRVVCGALLALPPLHVCDIHSSFIHSNTLCMRAPAPVSLSLCSCAETCGNTCLVATSAGSAAAAGSGAGAAATTVSGVAGTGSGAGTAVAAVVTGGATVEAEGATTGEGAARTAAAAVAAAGRAQLSGVRVLLPGTGSGLAAAAAVATRLPSSTRLLQATATSDAVDSILIGRAVVADAGAGVDWSRRQGVG